MTGSFPRETQFGWSRTPSVGCLIIAEAGVNHDGNLEQAMRLVDVAADARADAVKFQVFRADRLASASAPKAAYQREAATGPESQQAMLRRLELPFEAFRNIRDHCSVRGIEFLATPFDPESADFLDSLAVRAFKVGSGDLTNVDLLRHIAAKRRPMIVSTGMATLEEVSDAVRTVREFEGVELALLHCVSNYPTDPAEVNLSAMDTLRETFDVPVGFSDHTLGRCIALAAVARGASILEKHFTLNPSLPGPDHRMSLDPMQLASLVSEVRMIEASLGDGIKAPTSSEREIASVARRSLVAARDLAAGSVLTGDMVDVRRPGNGVPPKDKPRVLGRTLIRDIEEGELIHFEDLE